MAPATPSSNLKCPGSPMPRPLSLSKPSREWPRDNCVISCGASPVSLRRAENANDAHHYCERRRSRGETRGYGDGLASRVGTRCGTRGHRAELGNFTAAELGRNQSRTRRPLRDRAICRRRVEVFLQISDSFEQMPHFSFFCLEVGAGNFRDARLARHALEDANPGAFELADFFRIVGKQTNFRCAKFSQNLRGKKIIAGVCREAQSFIGLHRVHAAVLQFVSPEFVHQADAAAFLGQIEQNSRGCLADFFHRQFELRAAVAPERGENVAGQALRVDAYQGSGLSVQVAANQRDGFFLRAAASESADGEAAKTGWKRGVRDHAQAGGFSIWFLALL